MRAMKAFIPAIAALCLIATPALAVSTYTTPDGSLSVSASVLDINPNRIIATGKAHVKRIDKIAKTTLNADAQRILVVLNPGGKGPKSGMSAIKTADFTGPVKMIYTAVDQNGVTSKTTATSNDAHYDGATQLAYLMGGVKVTNENPALFEEPAVMTGDKATVNLKANPGPDEFKFRVESSPGVSEIQATPKVPAAKEGQ